MADIPEAVQWQYADTANQCLSGNELCSRFLVSRQIADVSLGSSGGNHCHHDRVTYDVVLLGAGASVDAGLPSTAHLAKHLLQDLEQQEQATRDSSDLGNVLGPNSLALRGIIGAVQRHSAFLGGDPFARRC